MIVIKIEMWPLGVKAKMYPLGRMYIWNKGTNTAANGKRGDYGFAIMRKNKLERVPGKNSTVAEGNIENWPRLSYSVWMLVAKALEIAFKKG